MNYDSYKNKPASEKITLAIMDAAKRLVAFELDAGTYRYTAPAPGIYEVSTTIYTSASNVLANTYHPAIYVNGAEVQYGHPVPSIASTTTGGYANWIGQLNAGDYVEIYWYGAGNNSASTMTIFGPSGTKNSSVHIKRLGGM